MKRVFLGFVLILILILGSFLPQLPGRSATHMPKTGLVIDTETGRTMPHVIVIATGWTSQGPILFGPGGYNTLYRIVTQTDAEGRYQIPATWAEFTMGVPGFSPRTGWAITVFQTGYAVEGDEQAWEFDGDGTANFRPASSLEIPSYSYNDLMIEVEPIKMYKPTLSLKQASVYYGNIRSAGGPYDLSTDLWDMAMREQGYKLLAPWVCALNDDEKIDSTTTLYLMGFSSDRLASRELLDDFAPGFVESSSIEMRTVDAGIACKLITNGRGAP
jgi:hypothetical protein